GEFERLTSGTRDEAEYEFGLPSGETVVDGEWILAIFELGPQGRATSAAGRAVFTPDGARLTFEPRDWRRLSTFVRIEARLAREAGARGCAARRAGPAGPRRDGGAPASACADAHPGHREIGRGQPDHAAAAAGSAYAGQRRAGHDRRR